MTDANPALTYSSYLALDEVLGAQRPRSDEHDELLFIVIHQVYELWFKQLLHEAGHAAGARSRPARRRTALHTLRRMLTILKVVVAQIDVLETMTPRQFTSFRDRLDASSGFQSAQFRELEAVLGRRDARVLVHYPEGGGRGSGSAPPWLAHRSSTRSWPTFAARGHDAPADRDVTQPVEAPEAVQDVLRRVRDGRRGGDRLPSASSTSTRDSRSGATAT